MDSLGLEMATSPKVELVCNQNNEFTMGDNVISIEKIYAAECKKRMEPLIIREEHSNCSRGLGADGRVINADDLDSIVLAKIGWNFDSDFQEQVS